MTLNILLIDDDVVDRQFLSRSFKHSSLDVSIYEAVDGASAIKLLADVSFDCIFLDYRLPDTDGLDLYSLIVEQDLHPSAPFVMLTGEGSEAIAVEAMKNGVHDYLVKGHITPAVPGFPRWMTNLMTCFVDSAIRINAIPSALRANPMSPGG